LQADVVIVFGLDVVGTTPILGVDPNLPFAYMSSFDLSDAWAQRMSLSLCSVFPEDLRVARSMCWLVEFRDWWIRQGDGRDWPVREAQNFHAEAYQWVQSGGGRMKLGDLALSNYIWFDENRRIRGFWAQAFIDVNRNSVGGAEALVHYERWNDHLQG
jgi:hypothetical protein